MAQLRFNSFPTTDEQPSGTRAVKVPAIKAIRALLGMGLKEAKEVIENLQAGIASEVFTVEMNDEGQELLKQFTEFGGSFSLDDGLNAKLRRLMDEAIDKGAISMAHDLLTLYAKYS